MKFANFFHRTLPVAAPVYNFLFTYTYLYLFTLIYLYLSSLYTWLNLTKLLYKLDKIDKYGE